MKEVYLFDPITQDRRLVTIKKAADILGVKECTISSIKSKGIANKGFYILDDVTSKTIKPLIQIGDLLEEVWRLIPGSSVEVSSRGRYRGKCGILVLNARNNKPTITINVDGKNMSLRAHYWVEQLFMEDKPKGKKTAHKDGNSFNNKVENLIYVSKGYINKQIALSSTAIPVLQLDPVTHEVVEEYVSMSEAARALYTTRDTIYRAVVEKRQSLGFIWVKDVEVIN